MQNKSITEEKFLYNPIPKEKDAVPVWLCFPSTYMVGMCSLGYLSIFKVLDQNKDIYPERLFIDTEKTYHHIKEVEMIGFSFSFELDFLNIFKTLKKYNIPLRAADRTDEHPIIFGGGPVLSANPEPYADFFDLITIGEGENKTLELINTYREVRNNSKKEKLLKLSKLSSVYVPSFYDVEYNSDDTIKSFKANINEAPDIINKECVELTQSMSTPILTDKAVFSNMFLVETARGCPRKCRFCIASYLTLPARYPKYEHIINAIDLGLNYTSKIGLLGALITEHPDFTRFANLFLKKEKKQK